MSRLATKANADRVGNNRKYNRYRSRLPLEYSGLWSSVREDYVGLQVEQLFRGHPHPVYVAGGPTNVETQVAAIPFIEGSSSYIERSSFCDIDLRTGARSKLACRVAGLAKGASAAWAMPRAS